MLQMRKLALITITLISGALLLLFRFQSMLRPAIDVYTLNTADQPQLTPARKSSLLPNGVFVIKVTKLQQACRTLCTLTRFLNSQTNYPIRVFVEQPYTESVLTEVLSYVGNADLRVTVDSERWKQLPPELTEEERTQVLSQCTNFETPEKAKCSEQKRSLNYLYMGYWRYMLLPYEPSLQEFEYYVSVDADGYFSQPLPDPFLLMQSNNLTGFYNSPMIQTGSMRNGIQEVAQSLFSIEERRNRYLDTPQNQYFDGKGMWIDRQGMQPSIWGSLYGARLDFFRTPRFREFARLMVPYTYTYRTDEQAVIAVAWSLMAGSNVWCTSQRDIQLGWYHQMWVDNNQVVRTEAVPPPLGYNATKNTSLYWLNTLTDYGSSWSVVNQHSLLLYEKYVATLGYKKGDDWERCICARTKVNYVLREACPNYTAYGSP